MEDIHRTHKEPAWGWIGALLDARRPSRPQTAEARSRARPLPGARASGRLLTDAAAPGATQA